MLARKHIKKKKNVLKLHRNNYSKQPNQIIFSFFFFFAGEVRPIVQYCPPGQNVTTSTKITEVGWDTPIFLSAPGTYIIETCNYGNNPTELPWGHHVIFYQAMEKMNGLKAECRIDIDISRKLFFFLAIK